MRISDWSSDVCSSDLDDLPLVQQVAEHLPLDNREPLAVARILQRLDQDRCSALRHRTGESLSSLARLELAGLVTEAIDGNRDRAARRRNVRQQMTRLRHYIGRALCRETG